LTVKLISSIFRESKIYKFGLYDVLLICLIFHEV